MHPGDLAGGFFDLEITWLLYCAGTATVQMGIAHKLSGRLPFLLATRTVYLPNRRTSLLVGQCQIILPGDKFSYFTIAKECRVEVISARAHSLTSKATINGINNS